MNDNVGERPLLSEKQLDTILELEKGSSFVIDNYQEISEVISSLNSCIDAVLENVNLIEKENDLIGDCFSLNDRQNSEKVQKRLSPLIGNPEKGQVEKDYDRLDLSHVINLDEKPKNFNIKELTITIKAVNTEIDKLGNDIDACCNLENNGINSVIVDIIVKDTAVDSKINEGGQDIGNIKQEKLKYEEIEDSHSGDSIVSDSGEISEVTDGIESCVGKILENVSLTKNENELIHNKSTVSYRKKMDEISEESHEGLQNDQMMTGNCDAFEVIYSAEEDEKSENFNKSLNVTNSTKQDIKKYCYSEENNVNSHNVETINKDLSVAYAKRDYNNKIADIEKFDVQKKPNSEIRKNENIDGIVSNESSCVNNGDRKISDINYSFSSVHKLSKNVTEKYNLSEEIELIQDGSVESNKKNVAEVNRDLNKLAGSYQTEHMKRNESCDAFGINYNISGAKKSENLKQYIEACCDSEEGHVISLVADEIMREVSLTHIKVDHYGRTVDNEKSDLQKKENHEMQKIENIENRNSINSCINRSLDNKFETFSMNPALSSDENFIKRLDTEINNSRVESINAYRNLEKHNSEIIDATLESTLANNHTNIGHINRILDNVESKAPESENICNEKKCINSSNEVSETSKFSEMFNFSGIEEESKESDIDFTVNTIEKSEEITQTSNIASENIRNDQMKNYDEVIIQTNYASNSSEICKDSIKIIDPDASYLCNQDGHACNNIKTDDFNSTVDVKHTVLIKDQGISNYSSKSIFNPDPETHEKDKSNNNSNSLNGGISEIDSEIQSCLDAVLENLSMKENEHNFRLNNTEKSITAYQKLNILSSSIRKSQKKKNKANMLEITTLKSKIKSVPCEDPDLIIISSNEDENCNDETTDQNSCDTSNKKAKNCNMRDFSRYKFYEEIDNELEILKAQCSDIEEKLTNAAEYLSAYEAYHCVSKVKKDLTFCMLSLEKLRVKFRNKALHNKPETSNEEMKPSCSHHQPWSEKPIETPYRYRTQAFTRLTKNASGLYEKIESRHSYVYNSQMPPQQTVKMPHKCRKRPEFFKSCEKNTCKNLHQKKCKLSHYSYEHSFQRSPEEKIKKCSKKCLSKNCTSYSKGIIGDRAARGTAIHTYSNKVDCFAEIGGFSKSFIAHKKLTFSKSNPKNCTGCTSHLNQMLKLSNPTEKFKSCAKLCSRKKIGKLFEREFELRECEKDDVLSSDLSNFSEISSDSDEESTSIHSDYNFGHSDYLNRTPKISKFTNDDGSSRKEKSRKRMRENLFERESPMYSSDSDNSVEFVESFGNRYDKDKTYEYATEKKRSNLINKHVSRKSDAVTTPAEDSFMTSNVSEKRKERKYINKKFRDEVNTSEDASPILANQLKRKKKTYEEITAPSKLAKTSSSSDAHKVLKSKCQGEGSKAKLQSCIVSPQSPAETNIRTPYKHIETKKDYNIFKNKTGNDYMSNINGCKPKLQSCVVSPSSYMPLSPLQAKAKRHKNEEIGYNSSQTFEKQTKEQNEARFGNLDNSRISENYDDVVQKSRNEGNEELSENEINNVKDMPSFFSFLKQRKGQYTNAQWLLNDPITMLASKDDENKELDKDHPFDIEDNLEVKSEKKKRKKNCTNLEYSVTNSVKVKKAVCSPQIASKVHERNLTMKPANKPEEDKNVSISSGKLDSFKMLNEAIKKKNVKKRTPLTSKIEDNFESAKVSEASTSVPGASSSKKVKGYFARSKEEK